MARSIKNAQIVKFPDPVIQKDAQFILCNKAGFLKYLKENDFRRTVTRIQYHHTYKPDYSNFNGDDHFDDLKSMDRYHEQKRGWSDIGQNITIFPDGLIGICRPFDVTPAGIYGANKHALCIEVYGNFDEGGDKMTRAQSSACTFVGAALSLEFNFTPDTDSVIYHHWWNTKGKRTNGADGGAKSCPGTAFFGGNKVEDAEVNLIPKIKKAKAVLLKGIEGGKI